MTAAKAPDRAVGDRRIESQAAMLEVESDGWVTIHPPDLAPAQPDRDRPGGEPNAVARSAFERAPGERVRHGSAHGKSQTDQE